MTYNVSSGTLNPTHSHSPSGGEQSTMFCAERLRSTPVRLYSWASIAPHAANAQHDAQLPWWSSILITTLSVSSKTFHASTTNRCRRDCLCPSVCPCVCASVRSPYVSWMNRYFNKSGHNWSLANTDEVMTLTRPLVQSSSDDRKKLWMWYCSSEPINGFQPNLTQICLISGHKQVWFWRPRVQRSKSQNTFYKTIFELTWARFCWFCNFSQMRSKG